MYNCAVLFIGNHFYILEELEEFQKLKAQKEAEGKEM